VRIEIPPGALVLLVGAAGSGKSTFARKHFRPTQVISSDFCRALVSDDEADQSVSKDAFEILHLIVAKRLGLGRLTVVDATNAKREWRAPLLALAAAHGAPAVAIVFDLPVDECLRQNAARSARVVDEEIVHMQCADLKASLENIATEGFARIYVLRTTDEVQQAAVRVLERPGEPPGKYFV
jgi:protein phosphatase